MKCRLPSENSIGVTVSDGSMALQSVSSIWRRGARFAVRPRSTTTSRCRNVTRADSRGISQLTVRTREENDADMCTDGRLQRRTIIGGMGIGYRFRGSMALAVSQTQNIQCSARRIGAAESDPISVEASTARPTHETDRVKLRSGSGDQTNASWRDSLLSGGARRR